MVRLVGVDESGIAKEAVVRAAGGSTGYYRSKRMEQNPGTFNDGAGEKGVGKFAEGDEDEESELEGVDSRVHVEFRREIKDSLMDFDFPVL